MPFDTTVAPLEAGHVGPELDEPPPVPLPEPGLVGVVPGTYMVLLYTVSLLPAPQYSKSLFAQVLLQSEAAVTTAPVLNELPQ